MPSGTRYLGSTRADGRYTIPGMRVGGPYTVTAQAIGFERQIRENVFLNLGVAADLDFSLTQAEVDDLRQGLEAIEERARSELGLVKENEEFYQVVPAPEDRP